MKMVKKCLNFNSLVSNSTDYLGKDVDFKGVVYRIRQMGSFSFLHVSVAKGIIQCILAKKTEEIREGSSVHIYGRVKSALIKDKFIYPRNIEIEVTTIEILSTPENPLPFDITKKNLNINNDIKFDMRMISMRYPKEKAIFKIQEGLVQGLRNFFISQECTEIRTPKIVKEGAEGGANIFELDYFGDKAYLTQSPQFYKEFCTGVFQRVFEIAPVFRAEKHNTNRHINEYTSVDVELGNINSFEDIMEFEVGALQSAIQNLKDHYQYEIELLEIELPMVESIPSLQFSEVKKIMREHFGLKDVEEGDLSPEEEIKIGEYAKKYTGSDFLFITHYPTSKRPFYAMDNPGNPLETLSFDLLFKGIEITTGGQRIHNYEELLNKMKSRQMNPEHFEFFTIAHKYGLMPHGGFGLGLERLTQKIIGLQSVKLATMFPRDLHRLAP